MDTVMFAALLWKVIDFLRQVVNFRTQKSAIVTQVTAWVGGVIMVMLAAHAQVSEGLVLPGSDAPLGLLDGSSLVLLGLLVSSLGSAFVDVKQAIDSSDSAAKPQLLGPPPPAG